MSVVRVTETPGAQTPWVEINRILGPDERFEICIKDRKLFLLAPKHPSQLSALLYYIRQTGIDVYLESHDIDLQPQVEHQVILSVRAFSEIIWHESGIVEVGVGCTLAHLQQFLHERNQEVAIEGNLFDFSRISLGALILDGQTGGMRRQANSFQETFLGLEFVSWEGSRINWGGPYHTRGAGPTFHHLLEGWNTFPGIIIKVILKTYPLPPARLCLAWKFHHKQQLWKQFHALQDFSKDWDYLDVVISGVETEQGFVFGQISGLKTEMEAFSKACPHFLEATQERERTQLQVYFKQKKLNIHCVPNEFDDLQPGEYLWKQSWNSKVYWITAKNFNGNNVPELLWRERITLSFR